MKNISCEKFKNSNHYLSTTKNFIKTTFCPLVKYATKRTSKTSPTFTGELKRIKGKQEQSISSPTKMTEQSISSPMGGSDKNLVVKIAHKGSMGDRYKMPQSVLIVMTRVKETDMLS